MCGANAADRHATQWESELGARGAVRVPRARVVPLPAPPASYTAAVERYLTGAGIAKASARIYRISLTTRERMFAGEPAPTGSARRGAKPPLFPVTAIDDPALPEMLAELAAAQAEETDADTVNREPPIARKAIGWWRCQGWIERDPPIGIERRSAPPDRTKALAENQIAALRRLDVALRERTQWKMLHESAARADEVLCLNVEDLYPQDKRGKITAKGGATDWCPGQGRFFAPGGEISAEEVLVDTAVLDDDGKILVRVTQQGEVLGAPSTRRTSAQAPAVLWPSSASLWGLRSPDSRKSSALPDVAILGASAGVKSKWGDNRVSISFCRPTFSGSSSRSVPKAIFAPSSCAHLLDQVLRLPVLPHPCSSTHPRSLVQLSETPSEGKRRPPRSRSAACPFAVAIREQGGMAESQPSW
ncbi:hypothetical protein [Streptomyces sp. KMM 9044]|uniref:hypothetical protein n=1 Tax=Streptomyces sp. KMM 9044 TaxID=2744474 RepID=UPI0021517C0F|nr:hypothetical protein [Streptomyces sp. KMM 9044]WAX82213.1 hypothetical protein HUV60_033230 [Streptomyces sp. KMM 9044]